MGRALVSRFRLRHLPDGDAFVSAYKSCRPFDSDLLVFATDVVFASPSAAAATIAGRSASGPIECKMADTGQSYRDWRAATLE